MARSVGANSASAATQIDEVEATEVTDGQTADVEATLEIEATLVVTDGEVIFGVEPITGPEATGLEEMDVPDDQADEGATEPFCIITLETVNVDVQQADCSSSDPVYSSWEPYPGAYSPPASDDEEKPPAEGLPWPNWPEPPLDAPPTAAVELPHTPIVVWSWYGLFGTLPFGSLPLPDGLLADQIATYRRLPIEEPEIETVMEDPSRLTSTIRAFSIIWLVWLTGIRWQVLLLLLQLQHAGCCISCYRASRGHERGAAPGLA